MNATASNRLQYADWLTWLTTKAEFPKALGNRFSKEVLERRDEQTRREKASVKV